LNATVLSPGRTTPGMVLAVDGMLMISIIRSGVRSGRGDLAALVPQVFPALSVLPQEHLPLDQAAF
jgi:hypothetical protein